MKKTKWPDLTKFKFLKSQIKRFYQQPGNICAGNLHILLDDGNIDNDDIKYCKREAIINNDYLGIEICNEFLKMTYLQRLRLIRGRYGPI